MEISNNINNLNPIKCSNQNCFYNNWLASIKQKSQNILSANEEKVLVSNHQLLDQRSITRQSQSNENTFINTNKIDGYKCRDILQTLLIDGCSIDFFEAAFKHFQELIATPCVTLYFSPDALLKNNLKVKNLAVATTLATYMQTKHHEIQFDNKYHSLYYALANDYTNIVDILLDLETTPNQPLLFLHSTCWDSIMCSIKKEEIYNSVFNFITKNLTTCEQQVSFLLKLFLTTEYLENSIDIFIEIFNILTKNLDDAKLQEILDKEIPKKENGNTKDLENKDLETAKMDYVIYLTEFRETLIPE